MSDIRPGRLDRRLEVLARTTTLDAAGGEEVEWSTLMTVWASREDTGGHEALRAGQVSAEVESRFVVRKPAQPLDATMRLRERGQEFNILRITELPGRDVGYEIVARSRDETGAVAG